MNLATELTEETKIAMHGSQIMNLFYKNDRFFTHKEIVDYVKESSWSRYDYIQPAIEQLLQRQELQHGTYGYCLYGHEKGLLEKKASNRPSMTREAVDKLTAEAKMEFFQNGGAII